MKKLIFGILSALAAAGTALPSFAADAAFTYQGVIREVGGAVPANKNRSVEFRLYDGPTSRTPLWGRAYSVLLDANGLFNIALTDAAGSEITDVPGTGLAAVLARNAGTTLYIGLTVDNSSGEISPRQALLSVPYAIHASDVAGASGDFAVAGNTTLAGKLDVAGEVKAASLTATSLTVNGNVKADTSGSFSGYGTIPKGGIIMWSGSANDIEDGWALCNGENGTPDLRNRFIVGAGGEYAVGSKGGAKEVTLTEAQMPAHTHDYTFKGADFKASWDDDNYVYDASGHYSGNNNTRTTEPRGGNQPHENRPPYYALCFIMRIK